MKSKCLVYILIFLFFSTNDALAQAGLHVYAGTVSMSNKMVEFTPEGTFHSGNHFGADFTINEGDMYFMGGIQLLNTDLIPSEEFKLTGHDILLRWIKPRVGLGFNIINTGKLFKLRLKTLASVDVMLHNEDVAAHAVNPRLNDGAASGIVGLGISIGPARIDAEYHLGVLNSYNEVKGSNFNFLLFNAGFFF